MNNNFHILGNKRAPVNLYYKSLQPLLTYHYNSRNNNTRRNNTDLNINNNLIKINKWNLSEMIDIRKKINLAIKKRIQFINNKEINKTLTRKTVIHSINDGKLNKKFNLNNTVGNNRIFTSHKNSKKKNLNNSRIYTNKGNIVKKRINFSKILNNSTKNYKLSQPKKKIIKNKIKNTIPFNINKININIINNNNININSIKTEGNIINNHSIKKNRKKNFTLDKLPQFDDELLKKDKIKEKENKSSHHKKIKNNNTNKRNSINYNISNRLKNIISNHNDNSLLSKKLIKNFKKIIIKKPYIANDYSLKHKKIKPVNYFQDYKKKNSSINKKLKKDFINISNYIKIKNINRNIIKKGIINKNKKYNLSSKPKRPYSKEEKSDNLIRIKDKPKEKRIKNKILKLVAKKVSLPEKILIRKINRSKNSHSSNIISKSEIKSRRAKSNSKSKNDESQKINIINDGKFFDKINNSECNIDDILQNKKIIEGEEDNFDDIYSIIKILNFDSMKKKDKIFCIDNNEEYLKYKMKFELIWEKQIFKK